MYTKYEYYTTKNKVIAVSTYAGRIVRGVAKCNPNDTFDLEKGKALAAARCNAKVAAKRAKNARRKYMEAHDNFVAVKVHLDKMDSYYGDAKEMLEDANKAVEYLLASF